MVSEPMLVWYIGECIISVMNINIDVKDPTHGYQHCNTFQILIYDGYVKVRESWYTQVIIWVNTILHHSDTRVILPRLGGSLDGV